MQRNRAVAFLLCCLASRVAFALGLGPLEATSALNEPFKGRIEVLGAKAEDFDALTVGLAGEEQFHRAGIERPAALFQLRFSVAESTDGKDYIAVTSKDPIREPFLNFLLEMNWANGRLLREYTVLLDPPLYDPNRRLAAAPVASAPRATPAPAPRPSAAPTRPSSAAAAGQRTSAPPVAPIPAHGEIAVGAGDTLWSLARSVRPDDSVSIQQMMLAILRQNPEAFSNGNVNMLRRGAVLHMPDDATMRSISAKEAAAEIRHQHQLWEEYRHHAGAAPAAQPLGTPAAAKAATPSEPTSAPAVDDANARLELVAPGGSAAGAASGKPGTAGAAGTASGDAKLVHDEALDSTKQQAGDLKDRLSEAEEIINILQRQVNIKDQELAALQARLAELGVKQGDLGTAEAPTTSTGAQPAEATPSETPTASTEVVPDDKSETPPVAEAPAASAESEPEIDVETGKTTPATEEPKTTAAAPTAEGESEIDVPAPAATPGFPASLVPASIAEKVPGGALGVIGLVLLFIVGIGAVIARTVLKGRGDTAQPVAVPLRTAPAIGSEDITEAAPLAAVATADEDRTETPTNFDPLATTPSLPAFDPNATVVDAAAEATVQQGAPESDPLEEVNVYLAYERFDQAEELVKRVIAQYPNRHEYKLRLLEVYYSSNDRVSYESAARELHDAVGENDPLWESALAMWAEMSPDRALFAEGGALAATLLPTGSAFVDITGSDADATEATLTHAPGGHDGALDFDLVGEATDTGTNNILDLTAEDGGANSEMIDLTSTAELAETGDMGSVLDLTGGPDEAQFDIGASGVFDLTEGAGESNEMLDITGGSAGGSDDSDFLDLSGGGSDLLDVTKTGDVSTVDDLDLLNVTSSGISSSAQSAEAELDTSALDFDLDAELEAAPGDAASSTFDISDTVAPAFNKADIDEDDILDITGGNLLAAGASGDELEFDIGGLDIEDHPTVEMELPAVVKATGLDLDLTAGGSGASELDFDIAAGGGDDLSSAFDISESEGDEGDLEITMGSNQPFDGELSLKGEELDAIALDGHDELGLDGDLDFELDGTTEIDSIAGDETVDMASAVALRGGPSLSLNGGDDDTSLDDLTLELDDALSKESGDNHLETLALDSLDIESDDHLDLGASQTIVMPVDHTIERQSAADEADTKLNLAKAYIELGDSDGARSILDEVAVEGTPAQQSEARTLLGRLKP